MLQIKRQVIKIAGESGQGINSIGEVVAKALKESGFYTFGYREYPSLVKGGYASHQTDFADHPLNSSSLKADVLLFFSRVSFHAYLPTLRAEGQVIHMLPQLELTETEQHLAKERAIKIAYLAADKLAQEAGGKAIMANVVMVGALWKLMGLALDPLKAVIRSEFAKKQNAIQSNIACMKKGYESKLEGLNILKINFTKTEKCKDDALLTGNHLIALGAITAGVRAYFAYPMTPSSSILSYLAQTYHETGMLVKQIDDEISVAQMAIGAMFAGTRALVATSGGGFDLMTESVSLSGMTETPFVCILAQRPGPSTGLPTWTSASDLNLATYAGHGEFPRCVIAVSDHKSAYTIIQNAFNIAEKYQIPVIVLTDKLIAESLFQVEKLADDVAVKRHLVKDSALAALKPTYRYKITSTGISSRWLPGQSDAAYAANSDEHSADGSITEDAALSLEMYSKRLRKQKTLLEELPEPELIGPQKAQVTLIGWGSVKNTVCDALNLWNENYSKKPVNYLHYEYVYPLRLKKLKQLIRKEQSLVLIENNSFAQLGSMLTAQTGYQFADKLLKFDGRPFFVEELIEYLEKKLLS